MKFNPLLSLSMLIAIVASLAATPLGAVFHDGSFQTFDTNTQLSQTDGLALLAEGGNPDTFLGEATAQNGSFNVGRTDGQIGGSNRPGSRFFEVDVDSANTTLSYASMFLPSNDWFIADQGGAGVDISALLNGTSTEQTIDVTTIYDAGTELEDFLRGGGTGPDPFGLASRLSDLDGGNPNNQNDFISTVTRTAGVNLFENFVNDNNEPIDRFLGASSGSLGTIRLSVVAVPEPSSTLACLLIGAVEPRSIWAWFFYAPRNFPICDMTSTP